MWLNNAMLILKNAHIRTLDSHNPAADALAIEPLSGRVAAVGRETDIIGELGHRAQIEDLQGAHILPGLTDAHLHLRTYAHNLKKLNLNGKSKADIVEAVAERVRASQPGTWIEGHGWAQADWADAAFPTAADLDQISLENPVYLTAVSLHAAWCNGAALKAAGLTHNTPDPAHGSFGRDVDGRPNGMLFESAMEVVSAAIPRPSLEDDAAMIGAAQHELWELGLTGVHDFDRQASFRALQSLRREDQLRLRVHKHLPVKSLDAISESGLVSGFGDEWLWLGAIKAFADGALGPRTAAMLAPYEGEPDNTGMLFLDREELFEMGRKAALAGFPMTVHAIGDRANHETLAAFAQLRDEERANRLPHLRHRVEHAQIVHPDDFAKFKQLDVIASVQPIHTTSDMHMADKHWGDRAQFSYAWRTLSDGGARLAFGSDAPVDTPNPFVGMHAAITRQRADGNPGKEGWFPDQRLTLDEALAGYTSGAAYAAGREHDLGRLARGTCADLIVLPEDIYMINPEELRHVRPDKVMVGGAWVLPT